MRLPSRMVPLLALALTFPLATTAQEIGKSPSVVLDGVPFQIVFEGGVVETVSYRITDAGGETLGEGEVAPGETVAAVGLVVTSRASLPLQVTLAGETHEIDPTFTPGWLSLLPPVLAILLALVFREVITALFAGVWLGALMVAGFNPLSATWRVIDQFVVPALGDTDGGHTQIVVFSLLLGGMVGIVARNGGTMGIVEAVAPFARTARRGKIATWIAGLAIFFDDYANTLIVGNTMRPVTDRLKISREKLAYIVDSTAAPVAALVPISTWVGYEISLIGDGFGIAAEQQAHDPALAAALAAAQAQPFDIFLQTIPFLFYPILALVFVFLTSVMNRDIGPMATAEERAATGNGLHRPGAMLATDTSGHTLDSKEGVRHLWWNAAIPVLTVVAVVLAGLYTTGRAIVGPDESLRIVFGAADPFSTLLWGSLSGCLMAIVLSVSQRILSMTEAIDAWLAGMRSMMIAMIILVLAWALGSVTQEVGTAGYLAQILSDTVPVALFPVIVFITAAAMSFATGTSWGTMAVLVPLVIPLTVSLGGAVGFSPGDGGAIFMGAIGSVLAGSIFGDHCSPISDTTVLSSTASACDHVDHVRTQLPYAVLVASVGMTLGNVGTAYGLPVWIALTLSVAILYATVRFFGKTVSVEER
ncbi:MAG: Na+/H+ antiporter NhaC family protein [Gemmatimonadota bacterium]|nr:Na+/H+ antiporter NhaC family protein [Gemmatimonadota bacterium]